MGRKKGKRQGDPSRDECESTDSEVGEDESLESKPLNSCPHVGKAVQLSNVKKNLKVAWVKVGQCSTCIKEKKGISSTLKIVERDARLKKENGGKLTLVEIKKAQLERAKTEQKTALENLKRERDEKSFERKPEEVSGNDNSDSIAREIDDQLKTESEAGKDEQSKEIIVEIEKPSIWLCLKCGGQGCGGADSNKHSLGHYKQPRSDLHCLVVNTEKWDIWCFECQQEVYVDSHKKLYEAVEFIKKINDQSSKNASSHVKPGVPKYVPGSYDAFKPTVKNAVAPISNSSIDLPRVKGLNNLGNTCFFNSVIQCLSQTLVLAQLLDSQVNQGIQFLASGISSSGSSVEEDEEDDCNFVDGYPDLNLKLSEGGPMLTSLSAFLKEMHNSKSTAITPSHLFTQVAKQSPKFRGMQQQDSHELLRYLMDGLRNEEARRQKTAILKNFGLTEKTDPKLVANSIKRKIQVYGRKANHSLLDKIFSGQMVSTIVCEECHHSSLNYEQFLDISLPVVEDKPSKPPPKSGSLKSLPDDGEATCCGAQEKKKSKSQIKKEKERLRKEKRSKKNSVSSISEHKIVDNSEKEIEEVQGNEDFDNDEVIKTSSETLEVTQDSKQVNSTHLKDAYSNGDEGNCEDEDGKVVEEEGEWEWDYGEPWEDKQILKLKAASNKSETKNDGSEYLNVSVDESDYESHINLGANSVHTKEPLEVEKIDETGASSNADIEDNDTEEYQGSWVLTKSLLNNLQQLDNLMKVNKNLDPHMQDLCKDLANMKMNNLGKLVSGEDSNFDLSRLKTFDQKAQIKHEWTSSTLTGLAPRYKTSPGECSIYSCLNNFTQSELLTGQNKWACDCCTEKSKVGSSSDCSKSEIGTVYSNASKQLLLFSPPAILTLHLKRFQQTLSGCKKVNKHVSFPLVLEMAAFFSSTSVAMPTVSLGQKQILYSLYGVVEHSGRLQGGHYTAFIKVRAADTDLTKFFSTPASKSCDIPIFLEEIQRKLKTNSLVINEGEEQIIEADLANNNLPNQTQQPRKWYHASDTSVSEVSEEKVLKSQAYLLFYERIL